MVYRIIIFILTALPIYAQSDDSLYFPLVVGNKWVYNTSHFGGGGPPSYGVLVMKITQTSIINGKRYYLFENYWETFRKEWVRFNKQTGYLVKYDSFLTQCNNERNLFKLNATVGDSITGYCTSNEYVCNFVRDTTLLGVPSKMKSFMYEYYGMLVDVAIWQFIKNIGPYFQFHVSGHNITHETKQTLKGCFINGILYGDTTSLIGINQISSEIPESYKLSQNYPNPFNPYTKIKFQIPASGFAELKVYNSIGEEITTLLKQYLAAGIYEADFDAINLPSGVYFYKLSADNFSETKKMVLVK